MCSTGRYPKNRKPHAHAYLKICKREGCDNVFTSGYGQQEFCKRNCRTEYHRINSIRKKYRLLEAVECYKQGMSYESVLAKFKITGYRFRPELDRQGIKRTYECANPACDVVVTHHNGVPRKYCSIDCYEYVRDEHNKTLKRRCRNCRNRFVYTRAIYCSHECRLKYLRRLKANREKTKTGDSPRGNWEPIETETSVEMWSRGKSGTEISLKLAELGFRRSRCAVIGKLHKLGKLGDRKRGHKNKIWSF